MALLTSALVAAHGVRTRLTRSSFGWRQLTAAVIAVAALTGPVVAAAAWMVRGADGPVHRDSGTRLPPFAQAELEASPGLRALLLQPRPDGRLGYDLAGADGSGLELVGIRPTAGQRRALDDVVADLASPRGSDAAEALSTRAVRYVAVQPGPRTAALVDVLDAQPGLVRRSSGAIDLWQVLAPAARLSVLPAPLAQQAAKQRAPSRGTLRTAPPKALAAGAEAASATVPAGTGRLLVLADAADGRWRATVDGKDLKRRTAWGWAQAFELPDAGGHLSLSYRQGPRQAHLALQGLLLLVVVVLSVPSARRRRGLEEDLEEEDDVMEPQPRRLAVTAP
jgi:hypothetical protein